MERQILMVGYKLDLDQIDFILNIG